MLPSESIDSRNESARDLQELVWRIATHLVDTGEEVEVSGEWYHDELQCRIRVAPGEVGQVIGKRGGNIAALREVVACCAGKAGVRMRLEVEG